MLEENNVSMHDSRKKECLYVASSFDSFRDFFQLAVREELLPHSQSVKSAVRCR